MLESDFINNFNSYELIISPSYFMEKPYRELLMAIAYGDGKIYNSFKKAKLNQQIGEEILQELISLGTIFIEKSREAPLKLHPKYKLKKDLRSYRIQDKLRFSKPYYRFWFAFVEPYKEELKNGDGKKFIENFKKHSERLNSLVYEQLSNAQLIEYYSNSTPIISSSSFWNHYSEFDILAINSKKELILGECKYKDRKVCKNELNKLKEKAKQSGLKVTIYVLFSKSGFSNELLSLNDNNLLLFDKNDLNRLGLNLLN